VSVHLDDERTRSRQTTRIASVFPLPDAFKDQGSGAQPRVEVIRSGHRQGQPYLEYRYYITSWTDRADALQHAFVIIGASRICCIISLGGVSLDYTGDRPVQKRLFSAIANARFPLLLE